MVSAVADWERGSGDVSKEREVGTDFRKEGHSA